MKTIRLLVLAVAAISLAGCIRDKIAPETKTYTVTVTSAGNGTATAEPAKAAEGTTITLTAVPGDGYELVQWVVVSGGVTLENTDDVNTATFKMPAEDVAIEAEFAEFDVFRHIVDENFLGYCAGFDTDGDGRLSLDEAAAVTEILVDEEDIESLAGIEYFVSLEGLECAGNSLGDLDLSANTALKWIWCVQSQLTALDISANTALAEVYCNDNRLTELDASSMALDGNGEYNLYCGRQKTADGDDQPLTLTLRDDQKAFWSASLASSPANSNVVLAP